MTMCQTSTVMAATGPCSLFLNACFMIAASLLLCRGTRAAGLPWAEHCQQLTLQASQEGCRNFTQATNISDRLCAAQNWRKAERSSYYCSGITPTCLGMESRLSHGKDVVVQACVPAAEGAPCGYRPSTTCVEGMCMDMSGNIVDANYLPKKPVPAPAAIGGSAQVQQLSPAAAQSALAAASSSNTGAPTQMPARIDQDVIVVGIDTRVSGRQVPVGFLGVSYEWNAMGYYGQNPQVWSKMFRVLGPGHIIRLGGQSQESLTSVPSEAEWAGMSALARSEAQTRFIVGVPLGSNNPRLIQDIVNKAKSSLGDALLGIELGNEPMYWDCPGMGGWDDIGVFEPGETGYLPYFDRIARQVTGCAANATGGGDKFIMGPSWDNLNTFSYVTADQLLSRSSCYLKEYTLHYYPYYKASTFSTQALVSEALMREAARNVTAHVKRAAQYGQTLRISEANSLTNAGLYGVSGSFAAALWTADVAFEFATAGVTGVNFHWSFGGLPNGGVAPYAGIATIFLPDGTTAPRVRAPWYGYLLFQAAVQPKAAEKAYLGLTEASSSSPGYLGNVTAAAATAACQQGEIKVWPVLHDATNGRKELRVVVLHKGEAKDCSVVLNLTENFQDAKLTRVTTAGSAGNLTSEQVAFGGKRYQDLQPETSGTLQRQDVPSRTGGAGSTFVFNMPKASAALLVALST